MASRHMVYCIKKVRDVKSNNKECSSVIKWTEKMHNVGLQLYFLKENTLLRESTE